MLFYFSVQTEEVIESTPRDQSNRKRFYDSFPNIDDVINENGRDLNEAKQLTESILSNVPSGNVMELVTVCHVLQKVLQKHGIECLFFDSIHGKNLQDAFMNLPDLESNNRLFVLKLYSIEGLGGMSTPKSEHELIQLVERINTAIENGRSHPVLDDIVDRLSKVHHVDKKHILIMNVYDDKFNVVYKVEKQAEDAAEPIHSLSEEMKDRFPQFDCAKIHPLFNRPTFDISCFDERGNKTFPNQVDTYDIGPSGHTQCYRQPARWTRFGLNVMKRYEDGDHWLDPFRDNRNWYRAYHGTKNAKTIDFTGLLDDLDPKYACFDALSNIYKNGFCKARVTAHGPGVYCSPNPEFIEDHYAGSVEIDTQQGRKRYKCMLQVAVNPHGVFITNHKDIWVASEPEHIRPYGILIKEV
jgi:hypothetical protein